MIEIIPTVVPQSFNDISVAKTRYGAISGSLHVDASDGVFTAHRSWMPLSGEKLPDALSLRYEAHLMVEHPLSMGVAFARAGAVRVIGHLEAFSNAECAREAFDMWQKAGAKEVGIAILLDTRLEELAPYAELCDFVHAMTIQHVGKQGEPFAEQSVARIQSLHTLYPHMTISVDGGETVDTIDDLARAGATRFCVGKALAKAKDPMKEYNRLISAAHVA